MPLVETDWLEKNMDNVKIIDGSWHMPQTKRSGLKEYKEKHIPNSIFFDLDKNSKKETNSKSYIQLFDGNSLSGWKILNFDG